MHDDGDLPDDIDALKALLVKARASISQMQQDMAERDLEIERLKAQIDKVTVGSFASKARLELVKLIASLAPGKLRRTQLFSSGAEAVEAAIRLARSYTKKTDVIGFTGGIGLGKRLVRMALQASTVLDFASAKGGSGVTTVASNFALTLARESGASTVLIDLDLPLGNVAIDLGITAQFSTINAIETYERMDANLLQTLLTKHSSGLFVLAAPDRYTPITASDQTIEKLLSVARQEFEYVVVDAGSTMGSNYKALLEGANVAYLVTQVSIPELRNSNRLISEFFTLPTPKLEIVLNRFTANTLGIDEENIKKALTVQAHKFSQSAIQKIQAQGGKAEVLESA